MIAPQSYELSTRLDPQYLKRGIFSVPVFNGEVALKAKFAPLNFEQLNIAESDVLLSEATLILGVGSKKTFTAFPALKANGQDLAQSFAPPKYSARPRIMRSCFLYGSGRNSIKRIAIVKRIANTVPIPNAPAVNSIPYWYTHSAIMYANMFWNKTANQNHFRLTTDRKSVV